jgi:hypothetical protein
VADPEEKVPSVVAAALRGSGFPFQTAVAHAVRATSGWSVDASEYPWHDPAGGDQFLDLVITNGKLFLTVECKKTTKETLTFLRPLGHSNTGELADCRCLHAVQIQDSTKRVEIYCEEWALWPQSFQSEFCVVSTSQSGRDQRLLERDASLLIRATEAFAHDYREHFQPQQNTTFQPTLLFVPIIVTNAPLYAARYKPSVIPLDTGEFAAPPDEIQKVPWVRFRKAFTTEGGRDLGDRTIFVVSAPEFSEFLSLLELDPVQPEEGGRVHLQRRSKR